MICAGTIKIGDVVSTLIDGQPIVGAVVQYPTVSEWGVDDQSARVEWAIGGVENVALFALNRVRAPARPKAS